MRSLTLLALSLLLAMPLTAQANAPWPPELPAATRRTLDNGLEVILVPNANNPLLEIQVGFRVGSGADPLGREGTASLLGRLTTAGLPGRSEQEIARELARLGAFISADVSLESFVIGGQVPTFRDDEVVRFLDLFTALLHENTLPADILEREKSLRLGLLRRASDNAEAMVELAARMAALPGPWSRPGVGSFASIPAVTREDLLFFRERVLTPRNAVLIIGGAFDPQGLNAWIDRAFGSWTTDVELTPGELADRPARLCRSGACLDNLVASRPTGAPPRTILVTVDDPNLSQVPYRLVGLNPVAMQDPGWAAFRLGTFVLGGDFTSRLMQTLRVREGLTYGAYFSPDFGGHASGAMMVASDATPDALPGALALVRQELTRLISTPVDADELEMNRAMLVASFAFKLETISKTIDQYLSLSLAGLSPSWLASWKTRLAPPDAAAVQTAMAPLAPEALSLVVAGPSSLAATLEPFGPVWVVSARELLTTGLDGATPAP